MNPSDPWSILESGTSAERLQAARHLGTIGDANHLGRMLQIRSTEKDSWVRRALDNSIEQLRRSGVPIPATSIWTSDTTKTEIDDIRAVVTQKISRTLIHEARPLVADIILAARSELVAHYETSATAAAANRLNEFLDTILSLNDASKSPVSIEFDLAGLISDHVHDKGYDVRNVRATRQDSVVVLGDPGLVRLALDNAIRNAIEATEPGGAQIVVNCAGSESDAWIVILDEGGGLPSDFPNAFDPGTTTKSKDEHFGLGLAIADQAVRSLGGTIRLAPRDPRGTSCEIRWDQKKASSK
jgi:signal transduction histidine kinase